MRDYIVAISGVVGIVLTALFGLLTNRQKFREDLQGKYDATLHQQRTDVYLPLWKQLELLARFAPPEPVTTRRLHDLSKTLREWFFHQGGLFLSDDSRHAYLELQMTLVGFVRKHGISDQELSETLLDPIQEKTTVLRATLSKDIGSRKSAKF